MATSVVNPRVQFFANNGRPLIGGRIHTYVAGSSTRARTYKDAAKAQPNTNPIILDGRGEAQIYLAEGVEYKFVVEDSKGTLIYTQEPVYGAIWPNAEQWPSDATLSYQYMTEAKAAADAIGPIKFYDTYAQALADIASVPVDGLVEISQDETRAGARTRYFKRVGNVLEFAVNLDQLRLDLATSSGASAVGTSGSGSVDDAIRVRADIKHTFWAKGDDAANDEQAFRNADASTYSVIYVPDGIYKVGAYVPTKQYYGPGKLRITGDALRALDSIPNVPTYPAPNTVAGAGASRVGSFNTLFGYNVGGNFGSNAKRNALFGHNLGSGDTIYPEENALFNGADNNGYGYHALKKLQTGNSNNAFGGDALNELKTGSHNNAFGQAAGQQIVTQSDGCYFGSSAGGRADSGNGRAAYFGRDAGRENRNTSNNIANGWGAGRGVTPTPSTYTGDGATSTFNVPGYIFTGAKQVRIDIDGVNILPANYSVTGIDGNVTLSSPPANGASIVLTPTIGSSNWSESTILGARALFRYRTGVRMTVAGYAACENIDSGSNSVVIGDEAAFTAETIDGSIIIGPRAYRGVAGAINNKLIIANQSSTPFIEGNMIAVGDANNFLTIDAILRPAFDATRINGTALRRWDVVFARDGAISTSDAREKTAPQDISDEVLDAWGDVNLVAFQWLHAIQEKGEEVARWHFGVIAQQVRDAFAARGLDGTRYGLLCYDEWEAKPEVLDGEGNVVEPAQEAGNRWGIRADQCLFLEAAYQRRRADRIEQRLAALESRLTD